jgi:DNA-binding NarL/FixJ family response regulator
VPLNVTRVEKCICSSVPSHKILIVEDFAPFRQFIVSELQRRPEFCVVGQASDGLQAVERAEELQPDLILLDIGLPSLNGIEVARRLRKLSPNSRIIFVTQELSPEAVEEAFSLGASGYVVKVHADSELLAAVDAVFGGQKFLSRALELSGQTSAPSHRHEMQFYADEVVFLRSFTRFIATALMAGSAAIVVVTKSHQHSLAQGLMAEGLDIESAIKEGRYIAVDAAETLSAISVNGLPDRFRFFEGITGLLDSASRAAKTTHPRVAFCGERVGLLWAEGKADAALQLEKLCNELSKMRDVDILCACPLLRGYEEQPEFEGVCAEHTAVYFP